MTAPCPQRGVLCWPRLGRRGEQGRNVPHLQASAPCYSPARMLLREGSLLTRSRHLSAAPELEALTALSSERAGPGNTTGILLPPKSPGNLCGDLGRHGCGSFQRQGSAKRPWRAGAGAERHSPLPRPSLTPDTAADAIWSHGSSSVGICLFTDTYNALLNFKAIGKHSVILKLIKRMH